MFFPEGAWLMTWREVVGRNCCLVLLKVNWGNADGARVGRREWRKQCCPEICAHRVAWETEDFPEFLSL